MAAHSSIFRVFAIFTQTEILMGAFKTRYYDKSDAFNESRIIYEEKASLILWRVIL